MGTHTLTLRRDMTCGPCYIASAADCPRQLACLSGINVGDVFRACRRMLALQRQDFSPAAAITAPPHPEMPGKRRRSARNGAKSR
jgi:hypothetical protein